MSRRKKETNIESSTGFSNPSDLSLEELESISITSLETINDSLLSNLNWNQGAIELVCLTLSADDQNVASGNLVLLGILFNTKTINANHFWICSSPTSLTISIPDLSVFSFPDGTMVSNYVPSSAFSFHFTRNNSLIQPSDLSSAELSDFCLRAFVYPTSDSYARILILLNPASEDSLASFPLYSDHGFPGIKLCDYEFPLTPAGPVSPLRRFWGFLLVPAIFPFKDWTPDICNLSLETGVFPNCWKMSRSIPIHKKDKKDDLSNFRPNFLKYWKKFCINECFHFSTIITFLKQINLVFCRDAMLCKQLLSF